VKLLLTNREKPLYPWLKEILVCPVCKSDVEVNGNMLVCVRSDCKKLYPIIEGIPVMLTDLTAHHKYEEQYFDQEFAGYEKYELENWRLSYIKRILDILRPKENQFYLDIGVGGSGYTVIEAARKGSKSVGLDVSIEGVKKAQYFARLELGAKSEQCAFVVGLAENLPFKTNVFDKMSSVSVLEHVPDDKQAIVEIARVVKPLGDVYLVVPNAYRRIIPIFWLPYYFWDKRIGHLRHYTAEGITDDFLKCDLSTKETLYTGHLVKLLQILLTRFLPVYQMKGSVAWWKLEEMDLKLKNKAYGLQLHLVYTKDVAK
jgi:ubiquinone/menaquinone biosynthesis C-methylase UbiE